MKKILFYRYNSICEPAMIQALKALECKVTELTEEMENKQVSATKCVQLVQEAFIKERYDAVFSVNFFPMLSEVCNLHQIPYICQTVDCPILELYSYSIKNPCNRIFLFDYAQYQEFCSKNPKGIFYLPLGADVEHYDSVIQKITEEDKKFISDVSFVGSLYREKNPFKQADNLPDYLHGYLDGISQAQLKVYGYNFLTEVLTEEMTEEYQKYQKLYQFPKNAERNKKAALAHSVLSYHIAELERYQLLGLLSKIFSVDVYTGSDTTDLPKIHNKGRVKTLTEMPKVFHLSKINLNFTMRAIQTGLPLRIWDIMGCGGFVLTNYQQEISEYFTIGQDLETFGSKEELVEKVNYYLNHEEERKQIAKNGYEKVKQAHTWKIRMKQILEIVFGEEK